MEIDKSVYRLSEVSESDEAAMHNNISSILAFLQREGVDCMSINPQGTTKTENIASLSKSFLFHFSNFTIALQIRSRFTGNSNNQVGQPKNSLQSLKFC